MANIQRRSMMLMEGLPCRFSRNGIYGISCPIRGSIRLDARELDYRGPFLGFVSDKPAKVGGRHRHRRAAQVEQPGLHLWIDESAVGFLVELLDDVSWRVLGRTDRSEERRGGK